MNIKVEIKKILKGDKPTKAYANIVIDDAVVIHGVGVVENEKGRYMSMPMTSWKTAKGEEVTGIVIKDLVKVHNIFIENNIFDGKSGLYGNSRGYVIFRPSVYDVAVKDNIFIAPEESDSPNYAIVFENSDRDKLLTQGNAFKGKITASEDELCAYEVSVK